MGLLKRGGLGHNLDHFGDWRSRDFHLSLAEFFLDKSEITMIIGRHTFYSIIWQTERT